MLSKKLREEFYVETQGNYCSEYYRYLGYKNSMSSPIAIFRAKGIETLFNRTEPHIFVNDLIVGNIRGLYCTENDVLQKHAKAFVSEIGERTFETNKDHFSPNYQHIISVGLPGILEEIDDSLNSHYNDEEKRETLEAMKITMVAFGKMIENYIKKANELKKNSEYDNKRLVFIEKNCQAILKRPPERFAEALQLVWFCHTAFLLEGRYAMALGRI